MSAQNPGHVASQFPQNCAQCHTITAWRPAQFDHALSRFPLTGAHTTVACADCHIGGEYTGTTSACYDCHRADYEGVQDPSHVGGQYPQNCTECHTTAAWQPASFDHAQTRFPLTGAHATAACQNCHVNGQYQGTTMACYDCHQDNYASAQNPDHAAGQLPHDCQPCHTTDSWRPSLFSHGQTQFPLTGAHTSALCQQCHLSGQFAGTSTQCYDCHQQDFANATVPNHVQGQYPHDCAVCHGTSAWEPLVLDHGLTAFPLTGRHTTVSCELCHVNGQYTGTPTDCYFCHEADYNGTSDPNHSVAGFPHDCVQCHSTSNWNAQFDHDALYFPIYSGAHRGVWNHCSDCHTNSGNYSVFSCIVCHEHNCADMINEHDNVPGFVCESNACYSCHRNGGGGGSAVRRDKAPVRRMK
jgi:hypothetical protein